MSDANNGGAKTAILKRLVGGRRTIPMRDDPLAATMETAGLIDSMPGSRNAAARRRWDLTDAGVAALVEIDGPLTDDEKAEWLTFPKTRIGNDGRPQKLLASPYGPRRKTFSIPRARYLMQKWRNHEDKAKAAADAVARVRAADVSKKAAKFRVVGKLSRAKRKAMKRKP